jgi:tetratricopeptide (TPR) repeat protein
MAEKTPDQRFQEALGLMKNKQYGEAMQAFNTLHNDYPGLSGPLTDLGIIYAQQKKRDEAIDTLTRAVNVDPNNAVAHNWLGILYRDGGDYRRAEDSYRKALAARTDYAFAHYNLAVLYDNYLHQPRDALVHYREYLRLSGGDDLKVQAWVKALEAQLDTGNQVMSGGK